MKNRSRKRTLTFERLETKATPAMLLVAIAPLDDETHQRVESVLQERTTRSEDTDDNWQFPHSVVTLLQFVDENTIPEAGEAAVCSPPTWDQCRAAEEMMKLEDRDLRTLVIAEQMDSEPEWNE